MGRPQAAAGPLTTAAGFALRYGVASPDSGTASSPGTGVDSGAGTDAYDHDFVVIGSGFGGSVSALRLAEKGYRVCVLERGRRFAPGDFPRTNWNLRRSLWLPMLKCFGILRLSVLRDAFVLSGAGVGGGSLVYANTLYVPPDPFFTAPAWSGLADWKVVLRPFYRRAQFMLGVTQNQVEGEPDRVLAEIAGELGRGDSYVTTPVAVHFGEAGRTVDDPYFGGAGPARTGCTLCGGCMVGCRHGPRTRSIATTCGSPSSSAPRSGRCVPSSTSAPCPAAATRSCTSAAAPGSPAIARCCAPATW